MRPRWTGLTLYRSSAPSVIAVDDENPVVEPSRENARFAADLLVFPERIGGMPSTTALTTPDAYGELPWLAGGHVFYGMQHAVRDAARKTGHAAFEFVGQLDWSRVDSRLPRKNLTAQLGKLDPSKRFFFWCVNTSPDGRGSHWIVLVLVLPRTFRRIHAVRDEERVRLQCFDPLGGSMPSDARDFVQEVMTDQLSTLLTLRNPRLRSEFEMDGRTVDWSRRFDFSGLERRRPAVQADGVQCGVWCIWYTHWRCLTAKDDVTTDFWQPRAQTTVERQIAFRRMYFGDEEGAPSHPVPPGSSTSQTTIDLTDD